MYDILLRVKVYEFYYWIFFFFPIWHGVFKYISYRTAVRILDKGWFHKNRNCVP